TGRDRSISERFIGRDLLLQGGRAPTQGGIVQRQVFGVVRTLELEVVDEAPLRKVGGQVVLGADAGVRRDPVQAGGKGCVARLGLEQVWIEVPRERQIPEEEGKHERAGARGGAR